MAAPDSAEFLRSEFAVELHPCHRQIEHRSAAWARTHLPLDGDRLQRFLDQGHCRWACLTHPVGDPERVQDISDLTLLLFATDDALSGGARAPLRAHQFLDEVRSVMGGERLANELPWLPGFRDVWARLESRMPAWQLRRVELGIVALIEATAAEVGWAMRDGVPDLDTYLRVRWDSIGAKIYVVMVEYARGIDIAEGQPARAALDGLYRSLFAHVIFTNDLFSFRKEADEGDEINAIASLCRHSGVDVDQAMTDVSGRIWRSEREFIAQREKIVSEAWGGRPDVRAAIEGLQQLVSGNLYWSQITSRYHSDEQLTRPSSLRRR